MKQMKKLYTLLAASLLAAPGAFAATELCPGEPVEFAISQDLNFDEGTVKISGYFIAPKTDQGTYDYNTWSYVYKDLTEDIDLIEVTRSCYSIGEYEFPVYIAEGVAPGAKVEFIDEEPLVFGNEYNYTCTAYQLDEDGNKKSNGYSKYCYLYIGEKPAAPSSSVSGDLDNLGLLHFSITAPSQNSLREDLQGPLEKLSLCQYVDYYTSNEIYAVENPEPGETYEFDLEFEQGATYRFQVYAVGKYGKSDPNSLEKYVGLDSPGKVSNVKGVQTADGVNITWEAPVNGKNMGVFDPASVLYKVYRRSGDLYYGTDVEIASGITDLSFVDTYEDLEEPTACYYGITAYNNLGDSDKVYTSANFVVGPDYELPFKESFSKDLGLYSTSTELAWTKSGSLESNPTTSDYSGYTGVNGTYYYGWDNDENTNDGYYVMKPYRWEDGEYQVALTSAGINFKDAEYPVLSFYTLGHFNNPMELAVELLLSSEDEAYEIFNVVPADDVAGEQNNPEDYKWVKKFISLEDAVGESAKLIFRAKQHLGDTSNGTLANIEFDEVLIDDYRSVKNIIVESKEDGTTLISWEAPANGSFGEPDAYRVYLNDESVLVTRPAADESEIALLSDDVEVDNEGSSAWLPSHSFAHEQDKDYTVKVQAIYGDIEALHSEEVAFKGGASVGVELVGIDTVKSVEYYDVNGFRISEPAKGQVIIKRVEGANGAVRMQKVVF